MINFRNILKTFALIKSFLQLILLKLQYMNSTSNSDILQQFRAIDIQISFERSKNFLRHWDFELGIESRKLGARRAPDRNNISEHCSQQAMHGKYEWYEDYWATMKGYAPVWHHGRIQRRLGSQWIDVIRDASLSCSYINYSNRMRAANVYRLSSLST